MLLGGAACGTTRDEEALDYEGAPICFEVATFGGYYPEGCTPGTPPEGSACEAEGVTCREDIVSDGAHFKQRIAHCHHGTWKYSSVPCSNECTATGPNPVEFSDDCEARTVESCAANPGATSDTQRLESAVHNLLVTECLGDLLDNQVQMEIVDGCVKRLSSNRGTAPCIDPLLKSIRWECGAGSSCVTVGLQSG